MVIKAVVFDFGGVLMDYARMKEIWKEVAEQLEITREQLFEKAGTLFKSLENAESLMTGKITGEDFEETIFLPAINQTFDLDIKEPIRIVRKFLDPDQMIYHDCMLKLVSHLRSIGIKTGLLTNNFFVDREKKLERTPIDRRLFDAVVESCLEGIQKPDESIFELCHSRIVLADPSIEKSQVVLLDDVAANCEAARKFGWHAIQVEPDTQKAVDTVLQLLSEKN